MRTILSRPETLSGIPCPAAIRTVRKCLSVAPALVALALAPHSAHAQPYTWTGNNAIGSWSLSSNWADGVPASRSTNDLIFGAATNKNSNNNIANPFRLQSLRLLDSGYTISGSSITFLGSSPQLIQTVAGTNNISTAIGFSALATIDIQSIDGILNLTGNILTSATAGLIKTGAGTLNLTGANNSLSKTLNVNSGTLNIKGGSKVSSTDSVLSDAPGSSSLVTLDGAGTRWDLYNTLIVGNSGTSTLNLTSGGSINSSHEGYLGYNAGASGTVTVDGSGSYWQPSNYLHIGHSGKGTLSITNGGSVANYIGYIGYDTTGSGTVTVDGAGSTWFSNDLGVGYRGTGTLNITNGGRVTSGDSSFIGAGGSGTVTVDGPGSTWDISSNPLSRVQIGFGYGVTATLNITNGGLVNSVTTEIGEDIYGSGTVTVDGPGSTWTNSDSLYVGYTGTGTVHIQNGGTVRNNTGYIGFYFAAAFGTVTVDGPGSTWINTNNLYVGSYGTGTLAITNGGNVTSVNSYLSYGYGSGTVTVDGSGSTWTNSGDLYVGDYTTGTVNIINGGTVTDSIGYLGNRATGKGTVTVDGAGSKWINTNSLLVGNLGTGTVNITNGGAVSVTGATSINSSSKIAADNGTLITDTLTGNGTIALTNDGLTLDQSGNSTFNGTVSGTGNLTKSGNGTLTLAGINSYTGTTIVREGTLAFDSASQSSTYSVSIDAILDFGGFDIVGGAKVTTNGTITGLGPDGLQLTSGTTLSGSGMVDGNLVNSSGIVSPGNSPGTLSVSGEYTQGPGGALNIEIASPSSFDLLAITGNATLGGTLNLTFATDLLSAGNPYSFDFLTTGGSINGFFDTVNVSNLPAGANYYFSTHSLTGGGQGLSVAVVVPEAGTGLLSLLAAPALLLSLRRKK